MADESKRCPNMVNDATDGRVLLQEDASPMRSNKIFHPCDSSYNQINKAI